MATTSALALTTCVRTHYVRTKMCKMRHPKSCKFWLKDARGCLRGDSCKYLHLNGEEGKSIKVRGKQTTSKEQDQKSNVTLNGNTLNIMEEPDLVEEKNNTVNKEIEEIITDEDKTDSVENEISLEK